MSEEQVSTLAVVATGIIHCVLCVCRSGGRLYLQTRGSKFVKFQELKLQECVISVFTDFLAYNCNFKISKS